MCQSRPSTKSRPKLCVLPSVCAIYSPSAHTPLQPRPTHLLSHKICRCEAHEFRRRGHHERLFVLLGLGILQGWLVKNKGGMLVSQLTAKQTEASAAKTDGGKETTKASKQSIGKLRDQCQNSCHLTAMVLADPKVTEDCHLLYLGCKVIRPGSRSKAQPLSQKPTTKD